MLVTKRFCETCIHYRAEGWVDFVVKATGRPIHGGPCRQRSYYNHEAAMSACGGNGYIPTTPKDGGTE